jgi:hypothetical protein
LGFTKYGNDVDLYARLVHGVGKPWTKQMKRGLNVEDDLRACYEKYVGPLEPHPEELTDPARPWVTGHVDGFAVSGAVVDFKSTSRWDTASWGTPGTDKVKPYIVCQMTHYCVLSGRDTWHVLCGMGEDVEVDGEDRFIYTQEPALYVGHLDLELAEMVATAIERFRVDHWEPRIWPEGMPIYNKRDIKRLRAKDAVAKTEGA